MYNGSMKLSWCFPAVTDALTHDQKSKLDDEAVAIARRAQSQGYREGGLCCTIDELDYHGWWTMETT